MATNEPAAPAIRTITLGILALQGAFQEHMTMFNKLALPKHVKLKTILVKTTAELQSTDALVIPGGESTTIALLARLSGMLDPLRQYVRDQKKPVWGTCAGAILLADDVAKGVKDGGQETFGGVRIKIARNGWGSQVESFEAALYVEALKDPTRAFRGVFIRAPIVMEVLPTPLPPALPVQVLARLSPDLLPFDPDIPNDDDPTDPRDDRTVVALRQGNKLVTTFHPELTLDGRFHEYFVKQCIFPSL